MTRGIPKRSFRISARRKKLIKSDINYRVSFEKTAEKRRELKKRLNKEFGLK